MDIRSDQKVSSHVIGKIETFTEEDTRYKKHHMQDNDLSVPFKVGTLGPHTVLPITISCPIVFSWMSSTVWNHFLFKGDFSFGKSQRVPNLGRRGPSHLGDLMLHQKNCTSCEVWADTLSWWSCQWPVIHSCSLLTYPNSVCRGIFQLNAKFNADSLLYLLKSFWMQQLHSTCALNGIYCPHWLVQWGCHCSHMNIQSTLWLPGYSNLVQTVLVILTMAGLLCVYCLCVYICIHRFLTVNIHYPTCHL